MVLNHHPRGALPLTPIIRPERKRRIGAVATTLLGCLEGLYHYNLDMLTKLLPISYPIMILMKWWNPRRKGWKTNKQKKGIGQTTKEGLEGEKGQEKEER